MIICNYVSLTLSNWNLDKGYPGLALNFFLWRSAGHPRLNFRWSNGSLGGHAHKKSLKYDGAKRPSGGRVWGCPPSHDRDFLHFQHVKVAFPCSV